MIVLARRLPQTLLASLVVLLAGCSRHAVPAPTSTTQTQMPAYTVDPATAGGITGAVHFTGRRPRPKWIDMSEDPACVAAHHGRQQDETILTGPGGGLANTFVYIEHGLEGKQFAVPTQPVVIDQRGCWFVPRVFGVQVGQPVQVVNSDPVTHNIHPMAMANREWNHSQGPGDPAITRRFTKQEVMLPIKCNIHGWMHAWAGVVAHPYFAVTGTDGAFRLPNLPPGTYTVTAWHEGSGTLHKEVTIAPHEQVELRFDMR